MITLRRARDRHCEHGARLGMWSTFHAGPAGDELSGGFGSLAALDEFRLSPGGAVPPRALREGDVLVYVREGSVAFKDSTGTLDVLRAGDFRCRTATEQVLHGQSNASRTDGAHAFEVVLRAANDGGAHVGAQKRFPAADRRRRLCLVGAPGGRDGALSIRADALVYSALLEPGQHVAYELAPARRAWLHVVDGSVALDDFLLGAGDGVGLSDERAVSLTAREAAEILLVDVGPEPVAASR